VLGGHTDCVLDLAIDARWIASCSKDERICAWNRTTIRPHHTLAHHEAAVKSTAVSDGQLVSGPNYYHNVGCRQWQLSTCLREARIRGRVHRFQGMCGSNFSSARSRLMCV
jgi:WD40 repeat protein